MWLPLLFSHSRCRVAEAVHAEASEAKAAAEADLDGSSKAGFSDVKITTFVIVINMLIMV